MMLSMTVFFKWILFWKINGDKHVCVNTPVYVIRDGVAATTDGGGDEVGGRDTSGLLLLLLLQLMTMIIIIFSTTLT